MSRACSTNGEKGNTCKILLGKPEGKRPLGRPRHRLAIFKWFLREIVWGGIDSIDLA
jgi:hypothetical protein